MLVLQRKLDDVVVCRLPNGQEITVAVVDIRGDAIRLGVEAPSDVQIIRGELVATWENAVGVAHAGRKRDRPA